MSLNMKKLITLVNFPEAKKYLELLTKRVIVLVR